MKMTIRWYTALPLEQALSKVFPDSEGSESSKLAQILQRQENHYVIGLSGFSPRMLRSGGADRFVESLESTSFLKVKGSAPILVEDVQIRQGPAGTVDARTGQAGIEFYLIFPRAAHSISLEDKSVEFVTEPGRFEIKKKFNLKRMVYEGKLEL